MAAQPRDADEAANKPKAPWIAKGDIDSFLQRMTTLNAPPQVNAEWVQNYGFAPASPGSLINLLEQLGLIDDEGNPNRDLWNEVRIPATRQSALERLVRGAYAGVFELVDVETATDADLVGTFVRVYGLGDPTRYIRTFRHLSQLAGIRLAANEVTDRPKPAKAAAARPRKAAPTEGARPKASVPALKDAGGSRSQAISVLLSVEIPRDWDEAEIVRRIKAVRRAAAAAESDEA